MKLQREEELLDLQHIGIYGGEQYNHRHVGGRVRKFVVAPLKLTTVKIYGVFLLCLSWERVRKIMEVGRVIGK